MGKASFTLDREYLAELLELPAGVRIVEVRGGIYADPVIIIEGEQFKSEAGTAIPVTPIIHREQRWVEFKV